MNLNELQPLSGATRSRKRVGRGIGSGSGKTAGRGVKGQKARSGVALKGFEGGQMPIYRRLPKRGFKNFFRKCFNILSLAQIQTAFDRGKFEKDTPVKIETLLKAGLIRRVEDGVRILSVGELKTGLSFEVSSASKTAIEKIKKAGGTITFLSRGEAESERS